MKKLILLSLLSIPLFASSQVVLGQKDDFEDYTTRNWTKTNSLANSNILDGGPLGAGDNFLRVVSSGTGTNLNLMTLNNSQWTGNYYQNNLSGRIKYISMDVRNSGSNIIFLRLAFKRLYGSVTYSYCSMNAIAILPNEGWKKVSFSIQESSMVGVTSSYDYQVVFGNVNEMRILHNDVPSWEGAAVVATLDIDNIMAESQALSTEDFTINTSYKVVPNPANDFITVYSNTNLVDAIEYQIIDLTGRIVKKGLSKLNEKIDVEHLTSGNYLIQINTENGIHISKKLIKN